MTRILVSGCSATTGRTVDREVARTFNLHVVDSVYSAKSLASWCHRVGPPGIFGNHRAQRGNYRCQLATDNFDNSSLVRWGFRKVQLHTMLHNGDSRSGKYKVIQIASIRPDCTHYSLAHLAHLAHFAHLAQLHIFFCCFLCTRHSYSCALASSACRMKMAKGASVHL